MLRPHTPLFNVATDASNGGGAAPTITPVAVAPGGTTLEIVTKAGGDPIGITTGSESPGLQVSESSAPKPGVIAQAAALLRGANGNAATIAALRTDLTTRDATIEQLRSDLAARDATIAGLNTELATYRTQAADLQTAITELKAKQTDVQTEVIHQLATAGLPEKDLPAGSTAAQATTAQELWKQAEATDDPVAKGKLAAKAMALEAAKKKPSI